ncbi:arabinofuranan 3-O-arabinosyltransferase [Nocardioides scoriae]|uniref:Arabinofuranan 3-O-arabinosyltransferase n=1 Tax=Nocardioides scoriae TaxID=642780 RepID=A0A1H1QH35_9ACTN|nr:alpha-(1->3)-arabinofuranosyltransferase family protein [Nocardioides scoriae]SDS22768.1 arabinofuranan 3-O-arabinosyltransferase [Nocardioides scoriae]
MSERETPAPEQEGGHRTRLRVAAACLLLVGLAFVQDPGLLAADTKFDLVVDPGRFLRRALHLWDPAGAFGQLQNQAYGYLWPMGPFFWLGDLLQLPGWVVQRGWWALLLCVAFVGAVQVVRALGVRSDLAALVAGAAYALSPRILTVIGPISIEAWPSALAPWVLLPLVLGSRTGSARRAAALSALAVAMVGGVNAAATFAVLPLGAVWVLTRSRGPRRRQLLVWWPLFTLLGTLWWLVPLFVLGAYSPPFLDFIETSSVTTFPTTVLDAMRGTSDWVPYLSLESRAGNDLVSQGYLALNSGVLLALGLAGLLVRRHPHRLFLSLSLLVGLVMVTAGHQGSVQGLFADGLGGLLDGALAPLRNVHKFDPVVRLPLVVGLGLVLQTLLDAGRARAGAAHLRVDRTVALGLALLAVTVCAGPALATRLAPGNAVLEVPGYWRATAAWLDRNATDGTTLLAPGSGFADYAWGSPKDEPLQYLTGSSWAVRNAIPLAPPGNIRALDRVEQSFARGEGSAGLAEQLRRAGVQHLVVRNDLAPREDVPDPVLVHQALARTPGLSRVATFGPSVGGGAHLFDGDRRLVVNGGWQAERPAVEVFALDAARGDAAATTAPTVVAGGPEDLADLVDAGVVGDGATVLAPDVPDGDLASLPAGTGVVLTDGLRARERSFGRIHDGASATLTPGDVRRTGNPTRDYLDAGQDAWSTTASLQGAAAVAASSSASDAIASGGADRGRLPYAALDGDALTEWVANRGGDRPDRWRVTFDRSRPLGTVTLLGGSSAGERQSVRVRTQAGTTAPVPLAAGVRAEVDLDGARTSWLEVEAVGSGPPLALADVGTDGLSVVRRLDLPTLPRAWGAPDAVVLRPDLDPRDGCAEVGAAVPCRPSVVRSSEEQAGAARGFALPAAAAYDAQLTVRPQPGAALDELLFREQPVSVAVSSTGVDDPRAGGLAAVDADPGTAWLADVDDPRPTLTVGWLQPQRVSGLSLALSDDLPAARPTEVVLTWSGGRRVVELDDDGEASFPALRTRLLRIAVTATAPTEDLDPGAPSGQVGAGVGELRLRGAAGLPLTPSARVVERGCGSGPMVEVDGTAVPTSVRASDADLYAGRSLPATLCTAGARAGGTPTGDDAGPLSLAAGTHEVVLRPGGGFEATSLVLRREGGVALPAVAADPVTATRPGPTELHTGAAAAGLVTVRQNRNAGWSATADGRSLTAVTVDGWQQGWLLEEPTDDLRARFGPDTVYRAGVGAGLVTLVGLLLGAALLRRRGDGARLPGLHEVRAPRVVGAAAAVVGGTLLAGWWGAGLAVLCVLADALRARRGWDPPVVPVAGLAVVASLAYLARPWGSPSGWAGDLAWPHYLVLVPVLLALVGSATERSRIAGRSTRR